MNLKTETRTNKFEFEKKRILLVLIQNGWNRRKTAEQLGISYRCLLYKLKEIAQSGVKLEGGKDDVARKSKGVTL